MKIGVALCAALLVSASHAADWPQWRGPNVLWRGSIGTGFSSMSVSNGRLYTMGNAHDQETIWCFDAVNGKEIWKHTYPSPLGPVYHEGGPVSTPTVEGD